MIEIVLTIQFLLEFSIVILAGMGIIFVSYFIYYGGLPYYHRCKERRFVKRCWKEHEIRLQRQRRQELYRKERERYPLFFLKDGIV